MIVSLVSKIIAVTDAVTATFSILVDIILASMIPATTIAGQNVLDLLIKRVPGHTGITTFHDSQIRAPSLTRWMVPVLPGLLSPINWLSTATRCHYVDIRPLMVCRLKRRLLIVKPPTAEIEMYMYKTLW